MKTLYYPLLGSMPIPAPRRCIGVSTKTEPSVRHQVGDEVEWQKPRMKKPKRGKITKISGDLVSVRDGFELPDEFDVSWIKRNLSLEHRLAREKEAV